MDPKLELRFDYLKTSVDPGISSCISEIQCEFRDSNEDLRMDPWILVWILDFQYESLDLIVVLGFMRGSLASCGTIVGIW